MGGTDAGLQIELEHFEGTQLPVASGTFAGSPMLAPQKLPCPRVQGYPWELGYVVQVATCLVLFGYMVLGPLLETLAAVLNSEGHAAIQLENTLGFAGVVLLLWELERVQNSR
jgi:hypothetical protein